MSRSDIFLSKDKGCTKNSLQTYFIYLSIHQKDGYNTKGEPVQGAIQHTTTTNTQHDIQQVHKQNKQWHYNLLPSLQTWNHE